MSGRGPRPPTEGGRGRARGPSRRMCRSVPGAPHTRPWSQSGLPPRPESPPKPRRRQGRLGRCGLKPAAAARISAQPLSGTGAGLKGRARKGCHGGADEGGAPQLGAPLLRASLNSCSAAPARRRPAREGARPRRSTGPLQAGPPGPLGAGPCGPFPEGGPATSQCAAPLAPRSGPKLPEVRCSGLQFSLRAARHNTRTGAPARSGCNRKQRASGACRGPRFEARAVSIHRSKVDAQGSSRSKRGGLLARIRTNIGPFGAWRAEATRAVTLSGLLGRTLPEILQYSQIWKYRTHQKSTSQMPVVGQIVLSDLGQNPEASDSPRLRSISTDIAKTAATFGPNSAKVGPMTVKVGPMPAGAKLTSRWAEFNRCSRWTDVDQCLAHFDRIRADSDQARTEFAPPNPML